MQQLERLGKSLPFFKTQGRENLRKGENIQDPETRLSIEFRHELEQLLEARGKNIIDTFEVVRQLVVPIGLATSAIHGVSPVSLVRQRWINREDDDTHIYSYGVNPRKSKWIIMSTLNSEGHYLRLPKNSRGEIRHTRLSGRGSSTDYRIRKATISDLLFYKNIASSIDQADAKIK